MFVCGVCGQRLERAGYCPSDGQPLVETSDALLGTEVGRYRLVRLLGEGGMGQVYLGVQPAIGSRVAIKILSNECTRNPELLQRFFAEARAVNVINHENIVSVIDMAQLADGRPYIVMEFIEGHTLGAVVRGGAAPIGGVVQAVSEVLSALGAAHALGIVHRDLKPDNVLVTAEGHAKVLDFGIAKLAPGLSSASPRTRTGALLGTPAYMAPEQISGAGSVDARTDLYAAGVVLFEAVTGRTPFEGETLFDLMRAHLEQEPPSPRSLRADLPPALEQVILTALRKDPAERFQSAAAMAQAMHLAARELAPDQWRVLSSRGALIKGVPTGDGRLRMTPSDAGVAPTVRSETPLPVRTEKDPRSRKLGVPLVIGALVAVVGGIVIIVLGQGGSDAPPKVAITEELAPVTEAPAPAPVVTPPAPMEAPGPTPVVTRTAPATPSPVTRAPESRTVAPAAPKTGPKIIGGGSAADHGVHSGSNVESGPGVTIGGGTPAPPAAQPPKSFTRPADYNPKKFDGGAYAPKALALARSVFPDAGFVRFDIANVFPTGLADLTLTDDDTTYWFRSPSHSARPPGVPANLEVEINCYVEVAVGAKQVKVRVRDLSVDANCKWKLRPLPRCTFAQLWAKAKAKGAKLDTFAKVGFLSDGEWWFDNEYDGEGLATSFADQCP